MTEGRVVPPPPDRVDPLTTTWSAGTSLYRVHPYRHPPDAFNPGTYGDRGRFHPLRNASGRLVPTLYVADSIDGALSETVLHNVYAGDVIMRCDPDWKDISDARPVTRIELTRDILVADLREPRSAQAGAEQDVRTNAAGLLPRTASGPSRVNIRTIGKLI